jgi:hypothetical protein
MSNSLPLSNKDIQLEKAIEALDRKGGQSFPEIFYDFLDIQLSFFCNNPDDTQNRLRQRIVDDNRFREALTTAMRCYGASAENYHDPLGDIFMNRISHGHNGQFFTPEHICDFMARIADPKAESISDPTCGSGRLLLAGLKLGRENGMEPLLYGNDLSITCAKMTLLNILINTAGGEVTCGDGLLQNFSQYRFYKIDRIRPVFGGASISTYWQYTLDNVMEVEDTRKKWWEDRYFEGWIPSNPIYSSEVATNFNTPKPAPEPLPTEIKVDSNGQLSLF